ncbi:conserved hypothetical protein [Talaromyces stipitatus ATCC 10500]|uniref:Zn(2)-C6 fungal-type domain-containing protein n=1 Tax=Talaromyces stipitatus (strain ATCC 10500 / CBS 375.48 / QM 6759 / NRRL 1006) TaxID=441959 RepID=B8MSP5_TALSN|nr:uncharacterized protein TSTA_005400 [Talaromyces stipitatus ATCC 10500]EED12503.1 conserved hypothetical protein [Talaromyces stipitatus ATCC 10500]
MEPPPKRRRPPLSCTECRRRKVKCDRKQPCCHCVLWTRPCVYVDKANLSQLTHQQILVGWSGPETDGQPIDGGPLPISRENEDVLPGNVIPSPTSAGDKAIIDIVTRLRAVEQLVSHRTGLCDVDAPGLTTDDPQVAKQDYISLNKSKLFGESHWSGASHVFRGISAFLNAESDDAEENEATRRLKLEMRSIIQKFKVISRNTKPSRPGSILSAQEIGIPSKQLADQMTELYMSRFESVFRILHVPSFRSEYEEYWRDPLQASDTLRLKVHLVITIGYSLCEPPSNQADPLRHETLRWVHFAQNWISAPLEKSRITISGLQIQCLLVLARQVLYIGGDLIWVSMGTIVRTAIQMGLHRDPKHFKNMTMLHAELRRRLWATILEMNLQAALDAGVPPSISFEDFDTEPPFNVDDDHLFDRVGILETLGSEVTTDTSLQLCLLRCIRPRLEILRCLNWAKTEDIQEKAHSLSTSINKINEACRQCWFCIKDYSEGSRVFKRNFADLLLRRFLLPFHRFLIDHAEERSLVYSSRKLSLDAAMALLSPKPSAEFTRLTMLGGGFFKHRLIHISIVLSLELLNEIEEHREDRIMDEPCRYRRLLIEEVREAQRQWAERIKLRETNIKLHMKLSMLLIQAEETGHNISIQQRMGQSGKASLESCFAAVQNRALPDYGRGEGRDDLFEIEEGFQDIDALEFFNFDDIWEPMGADVERGIGFNLTFV